MPKGQISLGFPLVLKISDIDLVYNKVKKIDIDPAYNRVKNRIRKKENSHDFT